MRIEAGLDAATSVFTWRFTSIDPDTGELPTTPDGGFLPPNVDPPEGQGSVVFTVDPLPGLPTGAEIRNQASIVFDLNNPIATGERLNTIDFEDPTSAVTAATAAPCSQAIRVTWSGSDAGSGIASYDVFVSTDGGPFTLWRQATAATSATYVGEWGRSYAFASIARDHAGNVEDGAPAPEASALVADCGPFDLAVTRIVAPKVVTLTARKPVVRKRIKVEIQNRSAATQTIPSLEALRKLADLDLRALASSCPDPTPILLAGKPQKKRPITLKSKKKLTVVYDVLFGCAVDPAKSRARDPGHETSSSTRSSTSARSAARMPSRSTTSARARSRRRRSWSRTRTARSRTRAAARRRRTGPSEIRCAWTSPTSGRSSRARHGLTYVAGGASSGGCTSRRPWIRSRRRSSARSRSATASSRPRPSRAWRSAGSSPSG